MGISVQEALRFEGLSQARIIAGQSGLHRIIKRISVIECPDYYNYKKLLREGDFFLTSFFAIKDDVIALFNMVKILIGSDSSGLCIIDQYMNTLPPKVKDLADHFAYPVLVIPRDTPYADIITDIMDAIIQKKEDIIIELKINNLLQSNNEEETKKMAHEINANFKSNILTLYIKGSQKVIQELTNLKRGYDHWTFLKYQNGFLLVLSFGDNDKKLISVHVKNLIKTMELCSHNFKLGISNVYHGLQNLNICMKEALFAFEAADKMLGKNFIYYGDLGIYKLLMPLKHQPEIKRFHDEILIPIIKHDEKYNTSLLKTAVSYTENGGDMRKTAEALFQHVNTIRYRIGKIKEIMGMEQMDGNFYEQLSIAVKIHKMF